MSVPGCETDLIRLNGRTGCRAQLAIKPRSPFNATLCRLNVRRERTDQIDEE
jgi:hypothetical protein